MIGVAISTTGQQHRLGFLETSVKAWRAAFDGPLFVTVDGSEFDAEAVLSLVGDYATVYQCGRPVDRASDSRQGVAVNKNTGLELLMDLSVDHLFLSDDDAFPLRAASLDKHIRMSEVGIQHSMVCWGAHKRFSTRKTYSTWDWPRGSVLYSTWGGVVAVGGMVEAFGTGGHEHVEWSRRFHIMGLTPDWYVAPIDNAGQGPDGRNAMGARNYWYCEDMPQPGEAVGSLVSRRRKITSVVRSTADTAKQELILDEMARNPRFVPYAAHLNGRASATLCSPEQIPVPRSQR
jgi:hypothetical protein